MFPLGILIYNNSNVPLLLNIGGILNSLSISIENILILCNLNIRCPNFIEGINGYTDIQHFRLYNFRYKFLNDNSNYPNRKL